MKGLFHKYDQSFVFLLACIWVIFVFSPFVFAPNEFLFSSGGDGLKNYFTYVYQVKYGSGTHFEGMNYPYGEHVIFTDNMPALVWAIQALAVVYPGITEYALGVLHLLLILSIPLGVLYVYKIFRHWDLPRIWAGIASMVIVSSCQQYIKIEGHFGMGFMCYLPMLLYWLMRYHRDKRSKYLLFYALLTLLFSFIHVYNLAFSLVLMLAYALSLFLIYFRKNKKTIFVQLLLTLSAALIPLIVFRIFMSLTDVVTDRSEYPDAVFLGVTKPIHFLMNPYSPLGRAFEPVFGAAEQSLGEGAVYLGLASMSLLIFVFVLLINHWFFRRKRGTLFQQIFPKGWGIWLLTALFLLILAMGIPISWGWTWLIDYMSVLRQFRTVGRFSWLVFYLVQIFLVLALYRIYILMLRKNLKKLGQGLVLLLATLAGLESWSLYEFFSRHHIEKSASYRRIFGLRSDFDFNARLESKGFASQDFQAILALPFYHIGSEKLWVGPAWNAALNQSMSLSLQTGLPIVDVMMSRTSWSQTFNTLRLVDGAFAEKPILAEFNEQPILVLVDTAGKSDPDELFLLQASQRLFAYDRYEIYSLRKEHLIALQSQVQDSILELVRLHPDPEGIIFADTTAFWYSNSFDDGIVEGLSGKAFWRKNRDDMYEFEKIEMPERRETNFVFSIWARVGNKDPFIPGYYVDQYNAEGQLVHQESFGAKTSTYTYGDLWLLLDKPMTIHPEARFFTIKVEDAFPGNRAYLALDNLAIYPQGAIYFKKEGAKIWINNRLQP